MSSVSPYDLHYILLSFDVLYQHDNPSCFLLSLSMVPYHNTKVGNKYVQHRKTSSSQPWSLVKSPRKNLKDTDPSIPNPEMLDLLGVA